MHLLAKGGRGSTKWQLGMDCGESEQGFNIKKRLEREGRCLSNLEWVSYYIT